MFRITRQVIQHNLPTVQEKGVGIHGAWLMRHHGVNYKSEKLCKLLWHNHLLLKEAQIHPNFTLSLSKAFKFIEILFNLNIKSVSKHI